jgi:hypothetical protein
MGVTDLYFVDNEMEVCYWQNIVDYACTCQPTSAPDVRTSEAMGDLFVADHGLQSLCLLFVDFFLSGARPALPMGVAPEAIVKKNWVWAQKYKHVDLKYFLFVIFFRCDFVLNYSSPLFFPMTQAPESMTRCIVLFDIYFFTLYTHLCLWYAVASLSSALGRI